MIAKIRTGQYFKGAFKYNLDKVNEGKAAAFYSVLFPQENPTFEEMHDAFMKMSMMCPNVSKPVFHTSLNFSPDECLDDSTLKAVVDEYMQRLGYGETPYAVYKHTDTNHQHVHIISVNITSVDGKYKKINDSYLHRRSEAISRVIEKEYGLVVATDVKKKRKELDFIPELKCYGEVNTYEHLKDVAEYIVNNCKFTNLYQLNILLNKYNIACFKNKTKLGEPHYKFTFQNPATRKNVGIGGTTRALGLSFSDEVLDKVMLKNREESKSKFSIWEDMKRMLLDKYLFISQADFDKYLKRKGMFKIGEGSYWDQSDKRVVTMEQFKLPKTFIADASLKKEYMANIVKSATEYRKKAGIFHESTMFSHPEYISGFRTFFAMQNTHLSKAQNSLLIESFLRYKTATLPDIIAKEHEKDIKLATKMLDYIERLHISEKTANLLLERFHINIQGEKILIGNSMDRILHEISKNELIPYVFDGENHAAKVQALNTTEFALIKAAINDQPYSYHKEEIEWERVLSFISEEYMEKYHIGEQPAVDSEIQNEFMPDYPEQGSIRFVSSDNEKEYLYKKKKKRRNQDEPLRKRKK